ncbi:MAG: Na+/H+ antiporter subunit E [Halorhodospira sp.]
MRIAVAAAGAGGVLLTVAAMGVLWLALTGGDPGGVLGALSVLAATAVAITLAPKRTPRRRLLAGIRLLGFFLVRSLLGALDIGYRALHPRMPLDPAWLNHPLALPEGEPRAVFLAAVSLLPGTLAADLRGTTLVVHALVPGAVEEVRALEARVARVYSEVIDRETA